MNPACVKGKVLIKSVDLILGRYMMAEVVYFASEEEAVQVENEIRAQIEKAEKLEKKNRVDR